MAGRTSIAETAPRAISARKFRLSGVIERQAAESAAFSEDLPVGLESVLAYGSPMTGKPADLTPVAYWLYLAGQKMLPNFVVGSLK